ncbi:MAG: PAS domain S-box protein [Pirellulaceae bacterium]
MDESSAGAAICDTLDFLIELAGDAETTDRLVSSYADLYEHSPDMLCSVDLETGKIVRCNQTLADTLGYTKAEVVGQAVIDLYHPDCQEHARRMFREFITRGEVRNEQLQVQRRDGLVIDVLLNATAVRDERGQILYSRSSWREITELKQAERKLAASEQRLRTILNTEPECVKLVDTEGTLLEMNPAGLSIIEADSAEQAVGKNLLPLVLPEHRDAFKDLMRRVFEGETGALAFELRGLRGSHRWVETHASPLRNADGTIIAMLSVTRDISEQKRVESELRENNERLENIVATAPGIVFSFRLRPDESSCIPYGGDRFAETYGLPPGCLAENAAPLFAMVHADDLADLREAITESARCLSDWRHEWRGHDPVRGELWIEVNAIPLRERDGSTLWHGVATEVTARKLDDLALRQSEARLRLAMDAAEMGSWDRDLRTGEIVWSEEHERLWGMPPGSFRGTFEEFEVRVHPEDRTGLAAAVTQARESQSPLAHEFRVVWPDGSIHWIAGQGRFDYDNSGQPIRMTGVVRNITERRLAEGRASSFGKILEGSRNEIYILDDQTLRFLQVNRGARQNTGYTAEELSRMTPMDLKPEFTVQIFEELILPLRSGETQLLRFTASHRRKNGTSYPVEVHLQPVTFEGRPAFVAIVLDITDRQRAEQEIKQLNLELEQRVAERTKELQLANDDLDAYAHSVAHDLRAPLRAIFGFAKALREDYADGLDEHGREYTDFIESAAQQMDELVSDVLEYSKIGRTKASLGAVDLDTIVARSLQPLDAVIRQRQAVVHVAGPLGTVVGNEGILVQAVTNLVSNATKFVEQGVGPRVQIRSEARNGSVRLWVEDNGVGIAPENHDRIFRVFERLHGVETFPGTGIGLAIVRRAIETMGGLCGVESEIGLGSRFWIELPGHGSVI